jgi:acyl-coenzyme A thioesterase PaaI-like protein
MTNDHDERVAGIWELGDAARDLAEAICLTEVPADELRTAAAELRAVRERLQKVVRTPSELAAVDDIETSTRTYNPVIGHGSVLAPPADFTRTADGGVTAVVTLRQQYEGPAFHVHGGVSALLLDQVFGRTVIENGRWGMTATLDVRYLRATPLYTPLRLTGRVTAVDGRKTWLEGAIAPDADPGRPLVTATSLVITPSEARQQAYFGAVRPFRKMQD